MPSFPHGTARQLSSQHQAASTQRGLQCHRFAALLVLLLVSTGRIFAQLAAVNGPIVFPSTNVGSNSAPQTVLLKTTSTETISGFSVPASQGGKQEYSVGAVSGCATDGATSNPVGTVCAVVITFSPAYPGLRPVPLQASTSQGKAAIGLNGLGTSPLAILTPGNLSTLAGQVNPPNCNAYSGPALQGPICNPSAGAVDSAGNVYVASFYSNTISRIDTAGNITVIAGTGAGGLSGVGGPATSATIERPSDVIVDPAGNVYFAAESAEQIFRIDATTQILTSVAGNGTQGYSGDGGPATQASLNRPEGVALDTQGNLYIEDQDNNLIRKVTPAGMITTVAGNPATINQGLPTYGGDGGPATQAGLALCCSGVYASYDSLTVDAAGNLYIGDSGHHVVRKVTTDGIIHTVAGNNAAGAGFSGDGGAATSAQLNWPMGVFVDPAGDLYIADFSNNRIRKVEAATQIISTVAGSGGSGSASSGLATQVSLNGPQKVVLDGRGNLYVADTKNNLVRKADISNPSLTFPTSTLVGSADTTDGPLGVILANIGNAPLTLPPPSAGLNPAVSAGFTPYNGGAGACPASGPSAPAGTLAQGSSCALQVTFTPVAAGSITGSLVVSDNSLNGSSPSATQIVTLAGTATPAPAPMPVLTPPALAFGSLTVGTTSMAQSARLQNTGNASLPISSFGFFGSNPGSFSETDTCGASLAAGSNCLISIFCTPSVAGALTASLAANFPSPIPQQSTTLTCAGTPAPAPQAALTPAAAAFGNVQVGSAASQMLTLANAGNAALPITSAAISGTQFAVSATTCGNSLPGGASCSYTVVFTPTAAASAMATFSVVDSVGTQSATLTGMGTPAPAAQAVLTPATVAFGSVQIGQGSSQRLTLTNAGNAALSITSAGVVAGPFTLTGQTCTTSLAAGASCTFSLTFTPTTATPQTAAFSVVDSVGTQTSALSGTGTPAPAPQAALTPASAAFGNIPANTTAPAQVFTLANAGTAALPVSSATLSGAGFTLTGNTCPAALAAGASCTFAVTFTPPAAGAYSATLTVVDSVGTQVSTLTGTGTPVVPADYTLTPTPSAQSSYRGQSVSYSIALASVSGANPFTGPVVLTATGLPGGATATFSPAMVVPGASSTLTVALAPLSSANRTLERGGAAFATLLLGIVITRRKRLAPRLLLLLLVALGSSFALAGCGSGNGFAIPVSTSSITITGTAGAIVHTTTVTLTVQ